MDGGPIRWTAQGKVETEDVCSSPFAASFRSQSILELEAPR